MKLKKVCSRPVIDQLLDFDVAALEHYFGVEKEGLASRDVRDTGGIDEAGD